MHMTRLAKSGGNRTVRIQKLAIVSIEDAIRKEKFVFHLHPFTKTVRRLFSARFFPALGGG